MRAVLAPHPRKTMGKDTALQVFAKRLLHIGRWCVMVPLAIELAGARQRKPGLEVRSHGAVQHAALRVTRVVELGFGFGRRQREGTRIGVGARMPIRLGGCAGAGNWHGSVPARTCSHGLGGAIWRCNGLWRTTPLGDALAAWCLL